MTYSYDVTYTDADDTRQWAEFDSPLTRYEMTRKLSEAAANRATLEITDWTGVKRTIDPTRITTIQQR